MGTAGSGDSDGHGIAEMGSIGGKEDPPHSHLLCEPLVYCVRGHIGDLYLMGLWFSRQGDTEPLVKSLPYLIQWKSCSLAICHPPLTFLVDSSTEEPLVWIDHPLGIVPTMLVKIVGELGNMSVLYCSNFWKEGDQH